MKSHRSTKIKITTHENGENVSPLETTKVVLVHRVIFNSNYQHHSKVLYLFFKVRHLVNYSIFSLKALYF